MPEPLTDEQLRQAGKLAENLSRLFFPAASELIHVMLAEVARLKAREADLVADLEMIRGGLVKRISDMEGASRKPSCPACGSSSIKRCDSEHAICRDCDLMFRAFGLPPEGHS